MNFKVKLDKAITGNDSLLCVGLDPDPKKFPGKTSIFEFNKKIIEETHDLVCCYKPNIAFYSAHGLGGLEDLKKTIDYIKRTSEIPVIIDAKRSDVPTTSVMYLKEIFDLLGADAVTVNPYLGLDSLEPFFERKEKGVIVLCRTSNPGASDFQDLLTGGEPLYLKVARKAVEWNAKYKNLLMVVGATWPDQIEKVREIAPSMTLLVPGIGTQGGVLEKVLEFGLTEEGKGLIISSSSGIIYSENPRSAAQKLKDEINKFRQ